MHLALGKAKMLQHGVSSACIPFCHPRQSEQVNSEDASAEQNQVKFAKQKRRVLSASAWFIGAYSLQTCISVKIVAQ